jgi:hypothetical protein
MSASRMKPWEIWGNVVVGIELIIKKKSTSDIKKDPSLHFDNSMFPASLCAKNPMVSYTVVAIVLKGLY